MNDFKIGDFVRSDTSDIFIGLIVGMTKTDMFHVVWHDGDHTHGETHRSMFHYEIQPSDWTPELYQAFSDIICP